MGSDADQRSTGGMHIRGPFSELALGPGDAMPDACVATFDSLHRIGRDAFRRRITRLAPSKLDEACRVLNRSLGCV